MIKEKYPSKRDAHMLAKNAENWWDGKRIDDNVATFWRIHDKIYDLSDFVDKHPGGEVLLETYQKDLCLCIDNNIS